MSERHSQATLQKVTLCSTGLNPLNLHHVAVAWRVALGLWHVACGNWFWAYGTWFASPFKEEKGQLNLDAVVKDLANSGRVPLPLKSLLQPRKQTDKSPFSIAAVWRGSGDWL